MPVKQAPQHTKLRLASAPVLPRKFMFMSASVADSAHASVYNKDNPFLAKITENRVLNRPGSSKETRHFVVHIGGSGLTYKAGDSLGVYPENRPSEVAELIKHLGATGDEPVMLPKATAPISLRDALTRPAAGPGRKAGASPAAKDLSRGGVDARCCWGLPAARESDRS